MSSLFRVHEPPSATASGSASSPAPTRPWSASTPSSAWARATSGPVITGISHLFEHMMFNGAKKYGPKEFDEVLEAHGGRSNAYTSNDLTVYYEDFATEALEQVIDLESDRMRSLTISDEMLEREREVVKEERRLRVDNDIMGHARRGAAARSCTRPTRTAGR